MNENTRIEIQSIKSELQSSLRELKAISNGVRKDFVGFGTDNCAKCIDNVIAQYSALYKKLNSIDLSIDGE